MRQEGWRWCAKCHGMMYAVLGSGACPAGGTHDPSRSGHYAVDVNDPAAAGQNGWRLCSKCKGLVHAGGGVCPTGGAHEVATSGDYTALHGGPVDPPVAAADGQQGWRWCSKCAGFYFPGNTVCPAGGGHGQATSGHYAAWHRAAPAIADASYDPAILQGAAGPRIDLSRPADDAAVLELAQWSLGLAMQGLGRALRHVERPDQEVLPADLGSAERRLVALLERHPERRQELVARLGAGGAVFAAALAPASALVRAWPTLSVLPRPLGVGPVAPTEVGQVASALTAERDSVAVMVRRIECLRESPGSGADELIVSLIVKGPGDAVKADGPLLVGEFDSGTSHDYTGDPLNIDWPTPRATLSLPMIKIGDEFRVAVILGEDDSINSFWTAMAQVVHQMGLVALYVYVAYQTGGNLADAAAATELADKTGRKIAELLQQSFAVADHLGMAASGWRYTGSPDDQPPPVDVYPKRSPSSPPDPEQSYYRIHFKVTTRVVPKPLDATPNATLTNPSHTVTPLDFVLQYDAVFRAIAVGWDAARDEPVLWGITADGRVKYRVGLPGSDTSGQDGWVVLPPATMQRLAAGWALDAAGMLHRVTDGGYAREGWTLQDVSVGRDGPVWGVQKDGSVWRRVGSEGTRVLDRWQRVPGAMTKVAVLNRSEIWGVSPQGRPLRWDGAAAFVPADSGIGALHVLGVAPGLVLGADAGGQLWSWGEASRTWGVWPAITRLRDGRRVPLVARQVCPVGIVGGQRVIYALDPQGRVHFHLARVG